MNIADHIHEALSRSISAASPKQRSQAFVTALADAFAASYEGKHYGQNVRVLCRGRDRHRRELGVNELLHDILVCRTGIARSPWRGSELHFIEEALWQVESEFANDSTKVVNDLNKLVLGSAANKLFIGPQTPDDSKFLALLCQASSHCAGTLFIALLPRPALWSEDRLAAGIDCWRRDGTTLVRLSRSGA